MGNPSIVGQILTSLLNPGLSEAVSRARSWLVLIASLVLLGAFLISVLRSLRDHNGN